MVSKAKILAIIPARGGSKTIPRKNINLFNGIPLIAYSIAAGLQAKLVNRVIVSTDDEEIAEIARSFGAEVPFIRPADLAWDDTPDLPVFQHALEWLGEYEGYTPDVVIHLRPTSPIRPPELVDKAAEILLTHSGADSVRSVALAEETPYKMWRLKNEKSPMENLLDLDKVKEPYNAPRQLLPVVYWQTGHIDAIRAPTILSGSMSGKNIFPLIIDPGYKVDIDTQSDWSKAEWLMDRLELPIVRPEN